MLSARKQQDMPFGQIPFIDLKAQRHRIGDRIDSAILKVADHGAYIMGPEVNELERTLSLRTGSKHVLSCANGTDALALVLMAKNIGPGDAVFVPAFTFVATAEVVAWVGATPFFIDVQENTFNIDPLSLERGIDAARAQGLKPAAIIPVDLFGQPADYQRLQVIADEHDLWILGDAAQSFGAQFQGRPVGSLALATATSFFPAKPLGCYGDGGAIFTDDDETAALIKSLRVHGQGTDKYDNVRIGMNARLDTIQAAILLQKLEIFDDEILARQKVADRYNAALHELASVPRLIPGATSAWAQYTLRLKEGQDRQHVINHCKARGVPAMVYYPIPLSRQAGYKSYPSVPGGVPVSEKLSQNVLSLPMHPYLTADIQDYIISVLTEILRR